MDPGVRTQKHKRTASFWQILKRKGHGSVENRTYKRYEVDDIPRPVNRYMVAFEAQTHPLTAIVIRALGLLGGESLESR